VSDIPDLDRPIYGGGPISRAIDRTPRQTYWALEQGHLPATKLGRLWVTTPRRIRDWLNGIAPQATS
jgi:hypothetical protein